MHSQVKPVAKVANMFKAHWDGVMNAVTINTTHAGRIAECADTVDQANSVRVPERPRCKTAIYFHLGGLDLYPASLKSAHTNS